ncbi:MAG: hypothetical protein ACREOC_16255 [Gemmatimonadales bacterium]
MPRPTATRQLLAVAAALLAGACQDQSQPTSPSSPSEPELRQIPQTPSLDPLELGRTVPGFGGFYLDADGAPTVYLRDQGGRGAVQAALAPFFQAHGLDPSQLRVLRGDFDYNQLDDWFAKVSPAALAVTGAVFVDLDEASNRLRIGVEHPAAQAAVLSTIGRVGVPAAALIVEETEPIHFMATLRDKVRPVLGGLQIHFSQYLCTLGFNASSSSGQSSFVTASHCTAKQGGVESTRYYQPLSSTSGSLIGTEVSDPTYFTGGVCPVGRKCRYSDAARAAYASGISFTRGRIEKTTGVNNGSLTISGYFSINAEGGGSVGSTANKVGRTTGWSQGTISNRCVNTNVSGGNITLLCQNWTKARVGSGDSGSPVFLGSGSSSVTLAGILWGGNSSGTVFVFSPMSGIERELGSLATF